MKIMTKLTAIVLPIVLLLPAIASANVVRPALEIQLFAGDTGAVLTDHGTDGFAFDVDATVIGIVTNDIAHPIDIPDQVFTLHATQNIGPSLGGITFSGTFNVAGGLLAGSFNNLGIIMSSTQDLSFSADLAYTSGSLMGNFQGGRIEGGQNAAGTQLSAKLGPVTVVPVPAAVWLFGSGLLGLAGIARRRAA